MRNELTNQELFTKLLGAIEKGNEIIKKEIKHHIETENKKLLETINYQNEKILKLEDKCEKLEQRNVILERKSRKNNIIVFGLNVHSEAGVVIDELNKLLGINLILSDFNNIYPLNNTSNPAFKIEFLSHLKKDLVFQNISKLKGTTIKILHDLCYEDRMNNKILVKHMREAREKNFNAKIVGQKLFINGEAFTAEDLEKVEKVEHNKETLPNIERPRYSCSAPSSPTVAELLTNNSIPDESEDETGLDFLNATVKPTTQKLKSRTNKPMIYGKRTTRNHSSTKY